MKKTIATILLGVMLFTVAVFRAPAAYAASETSTQKTGRFDEDLVGVSHLEAGVSFINGNAVCNGSVKVRLGYSVDVTMKLKRNGSVVATWYYHETSGHTLNIVENYAAVSGSTYQVVLSIKVYDSNGNYVTTIPYNSTTNTCP